MSEGNVPSGPRKLISRADLARLGGVTPAAVTQGCRFRLAAACVGDQVDVEHQAIKSWLADQRSKGRKRLTRGETSRRELRAKAAAKAEPPAPKRRAPRAKPGSAPELDESGLAEEIQDLTVREVADRFGTDRAYVNWLDAYTKQQRGRELWLKNEETEGSLIGRELVHTHVFAAIDGLFHRLLTDATRTIAARLYPMAKSGAPIEQGEREVREQLSKQLKAIKSKASRVLRASPAEK